MILSLRILGCTLFVDYYQYWGKVDKSDDSKYHLLVYHCLDVAAVANQYLLRFPWLLDGFAQSLGFEREFTQQLLVFLIALHDLGKFSEHFQHKVPSVRAALGQPEPKGSSRYHHDVCGQALWEKELSQIFTPKFLGDSKRYCQALNGLMQATTGHHGKPTTPQDCTLKNNFTDANKMAANEFCHAIFELIFFQPLAKNLSLDPYQVAEQVKKASWWLAGFTMLSDWLGSKADLFPYEKNIISLDNYWLYANQKAINALNHVGLVNPILHPQKIFSDLFSNIALPSSLQRSVMDLSIQPENQLFILEDLTGAGKTEAALFLCYRLMQEKLGNGFYIALPTMATANAMYDRVKDIYPLFFQNANELSCVLAHGKSQHDTFFQQTISEEKNLYDEEDNASARCNAWFADNRKKALLAPIGIGTVDQALQAILQNKHQALRLIGLYRKILIVDEVHACDAYMFELLKTLLMFHAASGGSAILLSATLPQKMRSQLMETFYQGRYGVDEPLTTSIDNRYPLITQLHGETVVTKTVTPSSHAKSTLQVESIYELDKVMLQINKSIEKNYCVCWIRNTVSDAIESYQSLKAQYPDRDITLFHSRFSLADRLRIEKKLLSDFGKKSCPATRTAKIVIATQVIEQSLDLDFDVMITDLAPIDLIIQRAGRLQRHIRLERDLARTLYIYGPPPDNNCESDCYKKIFEKGAFVYDNHQQLWLTAKLLQDHPLIDLYQDSRKLIEGVYGESDLIPPPRLQKIADKSEGRHQGDRAMADLVRLNFKEGYSSATGSWWDEQFCPTRLGEKNVLVYLAVLSDQQLVPLFPDDPDPWAMSAIQLRQSWFGWKDKEFEGTEWLMPSDPELRSLVTLAKESLPDKGKWSYLIALQKNDKESYQADLQVTLEAGPKLLTVIYDPQYGLTKT
jgi:CRISPR-associated endonuclease/helicase Cas3